jgi:hypothetical protein
VAVIKDKPGYLFHNPQAFLNTVQVGVNDPIYTFVFRIL